MAGSISPVRVPIMIPPSGVKPIEVSTEIPLSTAVIEAPFPMWQVITQLFDWFSKKLRFVGYILMTGSMGSIFTNFVFSIIFSRKITMGFFQALLYGKRCQIQQRW